MKEKHTSFRIYTFVTVALLALCSVYLWLWINPSLYLIKGYREFFTDIYFFRGFVDFPGNPAEYLSRLFIQFYNFPFVASLMIFLTLTAICFLNVKVFKGGKPAYLVSFIPVFILLLMHNDYSHSIRFNFNVLIICSALFIFTVSGRRSLRLVYFVYPLLLAIVLYLAGLFAAITFIIPVFFISLFWEKDAHSDSEKCIEKSTGILPEKISNLPGLSGLSGFLWLFANTIVVFILFYYLFSFTLHDLKQEFIDITRIYSFSYYPLIQYVSIIVMPLLNRIVPGLPATNKRKTAIISISVIPVMTVFLFFTSDKEERQSLQVRHYARSGDWEKTLRIARDCEFPDKTMVYYTNEALYHTGKIYNDLFLYNQSFGSEGLLLSEMSTFSEIVPNQEIFMQLGALSLSIIWGTEATNVYGANPYVLHNLTKAYLAGGYIKEAQKILNLLERTLFQKEWVKKYRAIANDTTLIRQDPELNRLRESQTPVAVVSKQSSLTNLFLLTGDSCLNKMAYNYLVIGTMLDHKRENFAFCISRLKDYGYEKIPKLYMEGLMYSSLYSSLPLDIRNFKYDESIILRFYAFQSDLQMLQRNPQEAKKKLKSKYGDTYWYYLLFDSPISDNERMSIFEKMAS